MESFKLATSRSGTNVSFLVWPFAGYRRPQHGFSALAINPEDTKHVVFAGDAIT